jgi:hypothetical protein
MSVLVLVVTTVPAVIVTIHIDYFAPGSFYIDDPPGFLAASSESGSNSTSDG